MIPKDWPKAKLETPQQPWRWEADLQTIFKMIFNQSYPGPLGSA